MPISARNGSLRQRAGTAHGMRFPKLRGRYFKMLFKGPAQMEFIIKPKVDGSLMESSLRLARQEMPSHFQSGLHLVSVERFLAGFPEAVVQGAGTDKMPSAISPAV